MLRFEFGAALVDHRVEPSVNSLPRVASLLTASRNDLPSREPQVDPSFFARWIRAAKVSSRVALRVKSDMSHRDARFQVIKPVEILTLSTRHGADHSPLPEPFAGKPDVRV
jgi:hypothetical protein